LAGASLLHMGCAAPSPSGSRHATRSVHLLLLGLLLRPEMRLYLQHL
jgi:hypothetical protein